VPTRDHSERMLKGFGAKLEVEVEADGTRIIRLTGEAELGPQQIVVPGDPSSAAFFVVAALIVPGSDLVIENVGLNPTRAALFDVLRLMGGRIEELDRREVGGEPVADLHVRHSVLTGIEVDPAVVPAMVDEFPVLFVAAALAQGRTVTSGLEELRVKESDRITVMRTALELAGARVTETADGMIIDGTSGEPLAGTPAGVAVATHLDHRIAMSMAVAGLASRAGVEIDDTRPIATSFPVFESLLQQIQMHEDHDLKSVHHQRTQTDAPKKNVTARSLRAAARERSAKRREKRASKNLDIASIVGLKPSNLHSKKAHFHIASVGKRATNQAKASKSNPLDVRKSAKKPTFEPNDDENSE